MLLVLAKLTYVHDKNFMDVAMVQMSSRESVIASNAWNVCFCHTGEESGLQFSRRFIAALTETTFKQCGTLVYWTFYPKIEKVWINMHNMITRTVKITLQENNKSLLLSCNQQVSVTIPEVTYQWPSQKSLILLQWGETDVINTFPTPV